jgi:hypothetical protein
MLDHTSSASGPQTIGSLTCLRKKPREQRVRRQTGPIVIARTKANAQIIYQLAARDLGITPRPALSAHERLDRVWSQLSDRERMEFLARNATLALEVIDRATAPPPPNQSRSNGHTQLFA